VTTPGAESENCFVCGSRNPIGLGIKFRLVNGLCRAEFTPDQNHTGWDTVVHGGILFAALDDVMANWLYLQGLHGYTARCDLRFRKPARVGGRLALVGRALQQRGQLITMQGRIEDANDGTLFAECEAGFMIPRDAVAKAAALLADANAGSTEDRSAV
jgi:uncharacterized protein (TIGR00369 family)